MSTENLGAFIVCANPDKPLVNAIIKYIKLHIKMIRTLQFGGVLKRVLFPTKYN